MHDRSRESSDYWLWIAQFHVIIGPDKRVESGLPTLGVWLRIYPMCGRFTFQPREALYVRL
jgi:hypothetical protein